MPSNFHSPAILKRFSLSLPERMDERHFALTLLAAFAIHLLALYVWWLSPKQQVIDIPVRALSIKLGDDVAREDLRAAPEVDNKGAVEATLSRLIREEPPETPKDAPKEKPAAKTKADGPVIVKPGEAAKQYVRDNANKAELPKAKAGDESSKAMLARYEQLISLWIQKFKQYPDEARRQGMRGDTLIRIRIDRRGNIRYWALEYSTGFAVLDRAAIDMVKRANPVPAVPNDYPPQEEFDFLIPVNFRLE